MFGRCPNCNTKFKKLEMEKLNLGMSAYTDESKYVKCHKCGRFFVTHILYSTLYLITSISFGLLSCVFAFFLNSPHGMTFGIIGFCMYIFRGQIHQYLPVVDVSDTSL
jgi:hypothetical protein